MFFEVLWTIVAIVIGYIIGSIPWALIIGKVFYGKDIREYGSGNLGGTNAGRVLGAKAGAAVIVLDALKALIYMIVLHFIAPYAIAYGGLAVIVGHCFPVFANFRGGKGVASAFGYLLGLGVFGVMDIFFVFVYPILIFLLILSLSRMVSLSSMCALLSAAIIACFTEDHIAYIIMLFMLAIFVIYRHSSNIIKIIKGKEGKVSWIR